MCPNFSGVLVVLTRGRCAFLNANCGDLPAFWCLVLFLGGYNYPAKRIRVRVKSKIGN